MANDLPATKPAKAFSLSFSTSGMRLGLHTRDCHAIAWYRFVGVCTITLGIADQVTATADFFRRGVHVEPHIAFGILLVVTAILRAHWEQRDARILSAAERCDAFAAIRRQIYHMLYLLIFVKGVCILCMHSPKSPTLAGELSFGEHDFDDFRVFVVYGYVAILAAYASLNLRHFGSIRKST